MLAVEAAADGAERLVQLELGQPGGERHRRVDGDRAAVRVMNDAPVGVDDVGRP